MQAAEELFAEKGFDGTSVRDIAETAGVNLAMINYYFGSKEKLMVAMFVWRTSFFKLQVETMLKNKELDPMAKLDALVDQYIMRLMSHQCFHRILMREQMVQGNEGIMEQIREMKRTNLALVGQLISEGQKKGVFRKHIDTSLIMATLVGTVGHVLSTQHYYREANNLEDLSEEEFKKHLKKKLSTHIKAIFKAIISNEN